MLFYVFTDYSKHIRAVCDIIYAVSLKRWERTMPKGIQKLIQRAKLSLKRSLLRSRKRRAAFKKAGGFRYACSGFIRALRARSPRAFMSLAGILLMLALVIIIPVTLAQGGRDAGKGAEPIVLSENAVNIADMLTPAPTQRWIEPTPVPTPTPVSMGKGATGAEVKAVQQRLMELGYMDYDEPTEKYGSITKEAVEVFQRRHGLTVDGYIGQETYDRLMREDAMPYMATIGDEGTDIEELQKRLVELDYMKHATGYFGDETAAAVKDFQDRNHLSVDGMIGNITKEALYSEDAIPRSLSYGEKSEDVLKYQKRLFKLGYLTTEPDGTFGKDTVAAVKLFQELNGLIADGHIGPQTKSELMSSSAQANALTIGMNGDTVKSMHKLLKKLGYLSSADGYYGSGTEAAVRAFQKQNGLSVDGKVGRATMTKLVSGNAKAAPSNQPASTPGSSGGSSNSGGSSSYSSGASADRLIEIALSKLGCRYRTGAKGPSTFDCSGFVYWCLNQAGVRQGYMTSKTWRSVSKYKKISSIDSVQKGDILVFRMSSSKGHVGIAINGSEMVDASSGEGCVVRRSYKTDYWRRYFYCAYRIF